MFESAMLIFTFAYDREALHGYYTLDQRNLWFRIKSIIRTLFCRRENKLINVLWQQRFRHFDILTTNFPPCFSTSMILVHKEMKMYEITREIIYIYTIAYKTLYPLFYSSIIHLKEGTSVLLFLPKYIALQRRHVEFLLGGGGEEI